MKLVPILRLLSCLLWLQNTSSASIGIQRGLQSTNYEPFPNGTPVRREFSDGWSFGIITGFNEQTEEYSVEWDNGEEMELHSKSTTALKVAAAGEDYVPYERGTLLREKKEDGSYRYGAIKSWTGGDTRTYTIDFDGENSAEIVSDLGEVDIMVKSAKNYIPYPEGTPIRKYFDGIGWAFGEVDSFDATEGSYKVTYMDGIQVSTHHLTKMDQKVAAAGEAYEPHPVGTVIRDYFEDLEEWGFGEITAYDADTRTYSIFLEGKGIKKDFEITDLVLIDQMVMGAGGYGYEPYEPGVELAREFEGDGLVTGQIIAYDEVTQTYTVQWENGETTTESDLALVDRSVDAVQTSNSYPKIGTPVRTRDSGFWFFGTIVDHPEDSTDGFLIDWGDNMQQKIYDIDILDEMTDAAADEYVAYNKGTKVCKPSSLVSSGVLTGEITSFDFDDREYRVEWENGNIKSYRDLGHIDHRVNKCIVEGLAIPSNSSSITKTTSKKGKGLFGAYIALALVATFGILVVAYELRVARRHTEVSKEILDREILNREASKIFFSETRQEFSDALEVVEDIPDPHVMLPAIA